MPPVRLVSYPWHMLWLPAVKVIRWQVGLNHFIKGVLQHINEAAELKIESL